MSQDADEVLLEYGRPARGVLPSALLVSVRAGAGAACVAEIAVEAGLGAAQVVLRGLDGAELGRTGLAAQSSAAGDVVYGAVELACLPDRFLVDVSAADGNRIGELGCLFDLAARSGSPAPAFHGLARAREGRLEVPSFGPPGAERCTRAVNLIGARTAAAGISLDLLVDDHGVAMAVTVAPGGGASVRAGLKPLMDRPDSPRKGRVVLPLGTALVELRFQGGDGTPLPDYACRLDLANLSFGPIEAATAPWPAATWPEHPVPPAGPGVDVSVAEATGEARPATGSPEPLEPPTSPPPPSRSLEPEPLPAAQAVPPQSPSLAGHRTGRTLPEGLIDELRDFVEEEAAVRAKPPRRWPSSIGAPGRSLGPAAVLGSGAMVVLNGVTVEESGARVDLTIDDGGLVAELRVGREGRILSRQEVLRPTPQCPVRMVIDVPGSEDVVLFAIDRHREALPNLSARIDLTQGTFDVLAPDPAVWHPQIAFARPVDAERARCAICDAPTRLEELLAFDTLEPERRQLLRSRFGAAPESRGVCRRCRVRLDEQLDDSGGWAQFSWAFGTRAAWRVVLASLGALSVFFGHGRFSTRLLATELSSTFDPWWALVTSATIWSCLFTIAPVDWIVGGGASAVERWRRFGRRPGVGPLIGPIALGLLAGLCGRTFVALPLDQVEIFLSDAYPGVTLAGFALGSMLLGLGGLFVESQIQLRRLRDRVPTALGEMVHWLEQMLAAASPEEVDRCLEAVLADVIGATEYVVFRFDQGEMAHVPVRSIGRPLRDVSHRKVIPGDGTISGLCLELGRPVSSGELKADRELASRVGSPEPRGVFALPLEGSGDLEGVVHVTQVSDEALAERLCPGLGVLARVLASAREQALRRQSAGVATVSGETLDGLYRPESLREAFGHHLTADVLRQVSQDPSILALGGETTQITVMVAALEGLHELEGTVEAPELVALVNRYLAALGGQVVRSGGFIDKFVDGSMVALFGRPKIIKDHAFKAFTVALELHRVLDAANHELGGRLPRPVGLWIGVSSGTALVGNLGSPERFNYSCAGRPPGEAWRLARLARSYRLPVLVSDSVRQAGGGRVPVRWVDRVRVDSGGSSPDPAPIDAFAPLAMRPGAAGPAETSLLALVDSAREQYLDRRFVEAARSFEHVAALIPSDPAARALVARCKRLATEPIGPAWDGTDPAGA